MKYVPLEITFPSATSSVMCIRTYISLCSSRITPPHSRPHLASLPHLYVHTRTHTYTYTPQSFSHPCLEFVCTFCTNFPHLALTHSTPLFPGLPENAAESAMVIEPSQPAEMADVDSEVDSEVVRQHAVWSGWGRSVVHNTSPLNAYSTAYNSVVLTFLV